MPQATRDRLRQRFLDTRGHWVPEGPKGKAPTGELPRRPYVRSDERAIGYVPYEKGELPDPLPATLVAFYLPQFHTIPENDEWWGKGFTEWRNVARALPQFEGHHQPKLPGDLGFYDLRNVEVMHEQARLAREYGISAFCFYFYWFGGKTLLETPLRNWLNDKSIDLKFCLCWANEKWTRTWDGRGDEILIDQKHSPEDDIAFIEHVAEYMRDPRYLRVDGKPMLLVYRPGLFPDMAATALRWRRWCSANGLGEIHLAYVQSFDFISPAEMGLDAAVSFPPNRSAVASVTASHKLINPDFRGSIIDWREMAALHRASEQSADFVLYPGVVPCWDNEARRPGSGRTFVHSSPRGYRDWLVATIRALSEEKPRLVFLNAWNEWAEGAVLEPDARLGHSFLQATRTALSHARQAPVKSNTSAPVHAIVHAWYDDVLEELLVDMHRSGMRWHLFVTTAADKSTQVSRILDKFPCEHTLLVAENRGRDILPFILAASRLVDEGVDFVLKLHTKRSPHRKDGEAWRRDLIAKLVSGGRACNIARAFAEQTRLGLVAPEGHIQPINYYWGSNKASVEHVTAVTGLPVLDMASETFVAGSMFWVRLEALRPILDAHLHPSDFELEQGQLDGTLAHAIERLFGACVRSSGFDVRTASEIINADAESDMRDYPYARRN